MALFAVLMMFADEGAGLSRYSCFSPLKRAYGRLVENKARLNISHIDKFDFLEAYPQARAEAFKVENIRNSFAASGLVPFNPEKCLGSSIYNSRPLHHQAAILLIVTTWLLSYRT